MSFSNALSLLTGSGKPRMISYLSSCSSSTSDSGRSYREIFSSESSGSQSDVTPPDSPSNETEYHYTLPHELGSGPSNNEMRVRHVRPTLRRGHFDYLNEVGYESEHEDSREDSPAVRRVRMKSRARRAMGIAPRPRQALVGLGIELDVSVGHPSESSPTSLDSEGFESPIVMPLVGSSLLPTTPECALSPLELSASLLEQDPEGFFSLRTQGYHPIGLGISLLEPAVATPPSSEFEEISL